MCQRHFHGPGDDSGAGEGQRFDLRDVDEVTGSDLPDGLALAWASSPCTDPSLAGSRGC